MPACGRTLTHDQARAFYDRFGRGQDWQRFYEGRPVRALLEHGRFESASRVVEMGCGTGRFAQQLLQDELPVEATYLALDSSSTMVGLTRERLGAFGGRVEVRQTDGSMCLEVPSGSCDRFVANYVLDLLSSEDSHELLAEARRILRPAGLLCVVSLTHGFTFVSRLIEGLWARVHRWRPEAVGGCRPIALASLLDAADWRPAYRERFSSLGVASEVLVAELQGAPECA
jgi:ubiquinone/menaquinone biosynthesis C-methylase UbiE